MLDSLIVGMSLSVSAIWGYTRYQKLKGKYEESQATCANLYDEVQLASQMKTRAETELGFLQQSIIQMMQKPVVATLSDHQILNITSALLTHMESTKDPGKMN